MDLLGSKAPQAEVVRTEPQELQESKGLRDQRVPPVLRESRESKDLRGRLVALDPQEIEGLEDLRVYKVLVERMVPQVPTLSTGQPRLISPAML